MKLALLATAALALTATPALAAEVVNGSFESPTVTSPSYGVGGSVVLTGGAGFEPNGGAFGYAAAPDGNQILHLQNGGTATLTLTNLMSGVLYNVSFFAAARPNYGTLPVTLVYNDGAALGTFSPTSTAFTRYTYSFTATGLGTGGSLAFIGGNGAGDLNTGIDNVTIAAVPEPATWGMMILGFGLVGFGLRRRRNEVRTSVRFA